MLTDLVEQNLAYDDYGAALRLADALFEGDRREDALDVLRAIVRRSYRLAHELELARYQARAGREVDARATLEQALARFEAQPDHERLRIGAAATEARRLLRTLEPEDG